MQAAFSTRSQTSRLATPDRALLCAVPGDDRDLWTGPPISAQIVMVFRFAVYLQTATGRPVAVCSRDAARMPFSATVPTHSSQMPTASWQLGSRGVIGGAQLRLGDEVLIAARFTPPTELPPVRISENTLHRLRSLINQCPLDLPTDLIAAAASAQTALPVSALIGRGSGLTPTGDDLLIGILAGYHAGGYDIKPFAGTIRARLDTTTWLSRQLIDAALGNRFSAPAAHLLSALPRSAAQWISAVNQLRAIGHTSGSALAVGIACGILRNSPTIIPTRKIADD